MSRYYSAAKINLFLRINGKRPDGYHDLTSVMQSVSLFDCLEFDFERPQFFLDTGACDLGETEKNIVTRMWRLLKQRYGLPGEVQVRLEKRIPVGAGLAGGSGNGAAMLKAAVDYFGLELSREEITALCAEIGADIAFCYYGGTMLATGIGECLKPLPALPRWPILLCNGNFFVSTPEMYRAYDEIALGMEIIPVEMMLHALEKGSKEGVLYSLYNGFEKVAYERFGSLRKLSDALDALFMPHLMSGSGPTVFAFPLEQAVKPLLKSPPAELGRVDLVYPCPKGIFTEDEIREL